MCRCRGGREGRWGICESRAQEKIGGRHGIGELLGSRGSGGSRALADDSFRIHKESRIGWVRLRAAGRLCLHRLPPQKANGMTRDQVADFYPVSPALIHWQAGGHRG